MDGIDGVERMKNTIIKIENKDVMGSLRKFLGQLLESKFVDALLVPKILPGGDGFVQSLIKDAEMLVDTNPVAPTMAVQSARILSDLTSSPFNGRIGVVLRPCELRAVVELVKFLQVDLDNVVTIGIDCIGTYEVRDYAAMEKKDRELSFQAFLEGARGGEIKLGEGHSFRESCEICEYPVPLNADMAIGFFGCNPSEEILLMVGNRFEADLAEKLSLELKEGNSVSRKNAVERIIRNRKKKRSGVLNELKGRINGLEKLMQTFSTCIRCHNCMNVCPICYCKECVFKTSVFEHRPDQFLNWAKRKGAIRMPADTLIFHLTRMSHMATSCIGCGMCDSACPNQLPVSSLFGLIGSELQELFEYVPGRDVEEEAPVSVFKEDELEDQTGAE